MAVEKQIRRSARSKRRATRSPVVARREIIAEPTPAATAAPQPVPPKPVSESDTTQFIRRESSRYDADTAIKLYLREIGQVKLLTPQEEIHLAARIKRATKKRANR